jgi:hypothetical protein
LQQLLHDLLHVFLGLFFKASSARTDSLPLRAKLALLNAEPVAAARDQNAASAGDGIQKKSR